MAILTKAALLAASRREMTAGSPSSTFQGNTSTMIGQAYSFWTLINKPGGTGAAPGTAGAQPTSATNGAIPFVNPAGGNKVYLADWRVQLAQADTRLGWLLLYDRLCANGGFDATSAALNTFSTPLTIGRGNTTGVGVMCFLEIYTTIGNTAATLTVTYTNEGGTGSRTGTVTWAPNSNAAGLACIVKLQSGDFGVRSVESCQWSGTTGAAGSYGITLARPLTPIPYLGGPTELGSDIYDALSLCMPEIDADACLAVLWQRAGAISGGASLFSHSLGFVEG